MHLSEIWHSKKNDSRLSRTQVINIRLAAAEAFSYATNGGVLCSFTFTRVCGILFATARKWSILPLRSARKMKKEEGGRIFEGF